MPKRESTLIIKKIESELKEVIKWVDTEIKQSFPSLLSYDLLTGRKRYISHNFDPQWDHSGTLFSYSKNANFDLADYEKVEDFLEEYTGNSVATYISHHGLSHETYREKYSDWFGEQYRNAHYDYFYNLGSEVLGPLMLDIHGNDYLEQYDTDDLINELIDEVEEFEDMSFLHAERLCSKINEMDLLLVYKLGEPKAKERLLQKQIERENATIQMRDEEDAFRKRWLLLEKKYRLTFQKPFPKRIEMRDFETFKHFLDQQHVSKEERALITKYAPISFSNSVFYKLRHVDSSL